MTPNISDLLIKPKPLAEPDRKHFASHQEYYLDNVNTGLENWFYLQLTNYLYDKKPNTLLREDYLANEARIYNLYVDKCNAFGLTPLTMKDLANEIQEILETWNDVFTYTEFDPNMES